VFGSRLLMIERRAKDRGRGRYVTVKVIGRPRAGTYIVPAIPWAQ
jgi:hypothetical protein